MNTKGHSFYGVRRIVASLVISTGVQAQIKPASVPVADPSALRQQAVLKMDARASLDILISSLSTTKETSVQAALMRGMLAGLDGRRNVPTPKDWDTLRTSMEKSENPDVARMSQQLSQIFGNKAAAAKSLATLRDKKAPVADRRDALKSLITQQNEETKTELEKLLDSPELRVDAIRAYSSLENEHAPEILLSRYSDFNFHGKRAVIETLSTRNNYSLALIKAIAEKRLPKEDIPAYIARSLQKQHSATFKSAYGDLAELSKDKEALINKYKGLLTTDIVNRGNASKGRAVYQRTCSPCHVMYGEGGKIGPELTGSNRADLDYILLNMLDPSGDIPDAYKLVSITTKGGQLLAGTIAEEDDQRIVLNMVGLPTTVLKSDIQSREIAPISMMPEGLIQTLKNAEVIDLVKYLRSIQQVDLPK